MFEVFDDFQQLQSPLEGLEVYGTFFNHLLIKDREALLIRIEPTMEHIDAVTDSIWYARGNEMPFDFFEDSPQEEQILNEQTYEDNPTYLITDELLKWKIKQLIQTHREGKDGTE